MRRPALTAMAFAIPVTGTGVVEAVVVPLPSCPRSFLPQQRIVPSERRMQAKSVPTETCMALRWQTLFSQKPEGQSPSPVQLLFLQRLPEQALTPEQVRAGGETHWPLAHVPKSTKLVPVQLWAPHVPVGNEQLPSALPAHAPAQDPEPHVPWPV